MKIDNIIAESQHKCPHCGGPVVEYSELMEKKDACYYKVKASAKVWPSAYASGRLVQCRKKGAGNYGKKNESVAEAANAAQQAAIAIAKKKKAGVDEAAPPGAKAERMVKHIKKGYAKDGKLSDKEKSIAYATAWKAHNKGVTEAMRPVPVDDQGNRIPDKMSSNEPKRPFGQPGDAKSSSQGVVTHTPTGIVHRSNHGDVTPRPRAVPEDASPDYIWIQGDFDGDTATTGSKQGSWRDQQTTQVELTRGRMSNVRPLSGPPPEGGKTIKQAQIPLTLDAGNTKFSTTGVDLQLTVAPNGYISQGGVGRVRGTAVVKIMRPGNVAEGTQQVDSLVTDALKIMRGSEASDAVAALKTVLGDREYNSRRGYYNFYVRQLLDMSGQQGMAEDMTRRGFLKAAGAMVLGSIGKVSAQTQNGSAVLLTQEYMREFVKQFNKFVKYPNVQALPDPNQMYTVNLQIISSKDGKILKTNITNPSGAPVLDKAIVDGINSMQYMPLTENGTAPEILNLMTHYPDPRGQTDFKDLPKSQPKSNSQSSQNTPDEFAASETTKKVLLDSLMLLYFSEYYNANPAWEKHKNEIISYGQGNNQTDYINKLFNKLKSDFDTLRKSDPEKWKRYANNTGAKASSIIQSMKKLGLSMSESYVAEDYNPEYDDEAGMADNNLETLERAVDGIDNLIQSGDNLPEWCQEKIAVAKSMLVAVWDYMYSEEASDEVDPEVDEMFEAMDQLAEEMARKKGVSVDLVWETFEAMDDHMLYETAAWRRKEGKSKKGGLNAKGVASYRRENPGSKLQTAVTTKPSKLKPGSKAAKRRKSFCARMGGVKGPMKKPNGKPTRKALALRKWNC